MKYAIIGGAGNISKPVVEKLLAADQQVTVVGRNAKHLEGLVAKGAKAAVGSVEDVDFLTKSFAGADAVYTMVPPNYGATDLKGWIGQIGKNFAKAIKANQSVKYVVNLSSIGAHMKNGAGPVDGLHRVEEALNELTDVNIKHLRPGYFFPNLLGNVSLAKSLGIIGSNFGGTVAKMVMSEPADIAETVTEELLIHNFEGHNIRYIASDERTTDDIAKVLGTAIGKPALPWVVFTDEQALEGMLNAGLPNEMSRNYVEMNQALQSGAMMEDYWKNRPASLQKTKLESFAKVFADVYNKEEMPVHS